MKLMTVGTVVLVVACGRADTPSLVVPEWVSPLLSIEGLSGPEAVRYDPDQDVYFIANFNGEAAGDSNGFITRATADGVIETLRFMEGTRDMPLHGPRGMFITGDTLWVADADGIHGFDRRVGSHLVFVDLRSFAPGFLNDIVQGPDGALYVTDTGGRRVFRVAGGVATLALDMGDEAPNGIAWDGANSRFLLAVWTEGNTIIAWDGTDHVTPVGVAGPGRNDGIELVEGGLLIASQTDTALYMLAAGIQRPVLRVRGRPADIGIDTRRGRVAVPYIALNRVDVWAVPVLE